MTMEHRRKLPGAPSFFFFRLLFLTSFSETFFRDQGFGLKSSDAEFMQ
jgi:hypothetical protein